MIRRRFLLYLIIAALFSVAATIAFAVYSLDRAIDHSLAQNLMFARSAARFVGGLVEQEGDRLDRLLEETPLDATKIEPFLRGYLERVHGTMLERGGVAVFDHRQRLIAAVTGEGGLAPPAVLNPALRRAHGKHGREVTDLWYGFDRKPRIAIIVGRGEGEAWRGAVGQVRIDEPGFLRPFDYFLMHGDTRLQLLDSKGVALFSTREDERYLSAVHGTYFTDRVRAGQPAQIECHSCHIDEEQARRFGSAAEEIADPERETEVTTLSPIDGTEWSMAVREGTKMLYAPMREIVFSSVALVAVVFGTFLGSFLLLARRVLTPMRQLAEAANAIAQGNDDAPILLEAEDEVAVLARSFETMRQRVKRPRLPGEPGGSDENRIPGELTPKITTDGTIRIPASAFDAQTSAAPAASAMKQAFRDTLATTLDSVLDGLENVELFRAAMLLLEGEALEPTLFTARGLETNALTPEAVESIAELGATQTTVSVSALVPLGVTLGEHAEARSFYVHKFRALESLRGQLWIGVHAGSEQLHLYLRPAVALIVTQVQSLLERNLLYEQLQQETQRKNQMLRHLFEAESLERKRIAREIHDETSQALTALLLLLETFPVNTDAARQEQSLEKAKDRVSDILEATDRMIKRLRPAVLDDLGLVEAVRSIGRNLLVASGVDFELNVTGEGTPVSAAVESEVFRVFQEAATNVVRHAEAARVRARLIIGPERLIASFEDDGQGMDLSWLGDPNARPRWGLMGMRERVVQLGGGIRFSRPQGGGLRIDIDVPREVKALERPARG